MAGSYEEKVAAMQYLEHREKQYDVRAVVDVYARNGGANGAPAVCDALVFIGSPNKSTNRNYLGPCPLPALARQIAESAGPSGPNSEYLFGLADAMRKMQVDDPELFELEQAVRAILRSPELPER